MPHSVEPTADWTHILQSRATLGHNFARVLGYFRDDGHVALGEIENGLRAGNAAAMIDPVELLKTRAFELGARHLAARAEALEYDARDCVEWHQSPEPLLEVVVALHTDFVALLDRLDRETNPLMIRTAPTGKFAQPFRI